VNATSGQDNPATNVTLSDQAKAIIARAQADQAVADRLQQAVDQSNGKTTSNSTSQSGSLDKIYQQISSANAQTGSQPNIVDGSIYGSPSISNTEFVAKYKNTLEWMVAQTAKDNSPQQAAALQAAIDNGTLKIQQASSVPGDTVRENITYTQGANGGSGMSTTQTGTVTGSAETAIQSGNAFQMWTEDRGTVYVSW
jgi:hypothetical protein